MKSKYILKKIILSVLCLSMVGLLSSCDDWTDPEGLDIKNPTIEDENNALYQEYLENLRNYKKTYHKMLIGWFDNSVKAPVSQAQHIKSVPDKVDIVSLMYGDNLTEIELAEMKSIREDKGTRVIYTIDYETFRQEIEDKNKEIEEGNVGSDNPRDLIDLIAELPGFIDSQLSLLEKYGYDGISINFAGKSTEFMTPAEAAEMEAIQNTIFGKLSSVMSANPGKLYIFEGKPENVLDQKLLQSFEYIVIRTFTAPSILRLAEMTKASLVEGVPANNIIVCAMPRSTDESDTETGTIIAPDGTIQNAITETAHWVCTPDSFTKAGLGIYRINDDYYNADLDYKLTREAIEIMNPSPKN